VAAALAITVFVACPIAGPTGRVIGADMTTLCSKFPRAQCTGGGARLVNANVDFVRGNQDLRLNMAELDAWLAEHPCGNAEISRNLNP